MRHSVVYCAYVVKGCWEAAVPKSMPPKGVRGQSLSQERFEFHALSDWFWCNVTVKLPYCHFAAIGRQVWRRGRGWSIFGGIVQYAEILWRYSPTDCYGPCSAELPWWHSSSPLYFLEHATYLSHCVMLSWPRDAINCMLPVVVCHCPRRRRGITFYLIKHCHKIPCYFLSTLVRGCCRSMSSAEIEYQFLTSSAFLDPSYSWQAAGELKTCRTSAATCFGFLTLA